MIPHLAALLVPSALLATHFEPDTDVTYTCKLGGSVIVIDQPEAAGRATVQVNGEALEYVFDQQKLVPREPRLPTYFFQADLKRWKLLNDNGETVETTVCKARFSSRARSVGFDRD